MSAREVSFARDEAYAARSQLTGFVQFCASRGEAGSKDPASLHAWSVREFRRFWALFLEWSELPASGSTDPVCEGDDIETARFFPELRLNFAEVMLRGNGAADDALALVAVDEGGGRVEMSFGELRARVHAVARGLREAGLRSGDRVVAVARNDAEVVVACLAATGLGATWSSVAPDLGLGAIRARFEALSPTWLFAHGRYAYQGRSFDLSATLTELIGALPSLEHCVDLDPSGSGVADLGPGGASLRGFERAGDPVAWPALPFDHPLYIMFSSGTTGAPKCIVHGVGGTVLEHAKEHRLHGDLRPGDRLHFHTSCGWMMWNWLISGIACGATVVVRDGSPTHPEPSSLWKMLADEKVTVFGSNPTFLQFSRDAGLSPGSAFDLSALRAMQSTGSILYEHQYDWVREHVKPLPMQSISGGTDILGCFVLGHPWRPVMRGESQSLSLGLDVRAVDAQTGDALGPGEVGELICARPFPSRPVGFFGEDGARRFHEAYFADHEGVWTHGDFVEIHADGGARILGRSDGVLNVRGIRIGPAEIYQVLQGFEEIQQCMAVEQRADHVPGGSQIVLLVVMREGHELDRPLTLAVKKALKVQASANHVPGVVAAVSGLPTTFSGKLSEKAAREAVHGREVPNRSALKNPECLEEIREKLAPPE